jgi:hypothetical protein
MLAIRSYIPSSKAWEHFLIYALSFLPTGFFDETENERSQYG